MDVIIAGGPQATWAATQATTTTPIVMVGSGPDPVATGLVVSLARPGCNVLLVSALAGVGVATALEVGE